MLGALLEEETQVRLVLIFRLRVVLIWGFLMEIRDGEIFSVTVRKNGLESNN